MIDQGREYTRNALESSSFVTKGKARVAAVAKGLADLKPGVVIDQVAKPNLIFTTSMMTTMKLLRNYL